MPEPNAKLAHIWREKISVDAEVDSGLDPLRAAVADELIPAILVRLSLWMAERGVTWSGTASELLAGLIATASVPQKIGSPDSPEQLWEELKEKKDLLARFGIEVESRPREGRPPFIVLRKADNWEFGSAKVRAMLDENGTAITEVSADVVAAPAPVIFQPQPPTLDLRTGLDSRSSALESYAQLFFGEPPQSELDEAGSFGPERSHFSDLEGDRDASEQPTQDPLRSADALDEPFASEFLGLDDFADQADRTNTSNGSHKEKDHSALRDHDDASQERFAEVGPTEPSVPVPPEESQKISEPDVALLRSFALTAEQPAEDKDSHRLRNIIITVVLVFLFSVLAAQRLGLLLGRDRTPSATEASSLEKVSASDYAVNDVPGLTQRAQAGDPRAQLALADMYERGITLRKDPAQALEWLRKSAENGDTIAAFRLGTFLEQDTAGRQSRVDAYTWYIVAATKGDELSDQAVRRLTPQLSQQEIARARLNLGRFYANGVAFPRDYTSAYFWFMVAEAAGSRDAGQERLRIASRMPAAQVEEARERASRWLRSHATNG